MAEIIESISGDKQLRLYDEQFGRRMDIGAQWGKIRVAIRFCVNATSNLNDCGIVLGVSQGTTDMFRSPNCVDFIGGHIGAVLQNTDWSYNAGPPAYSFSGGFSTLAVSKVAGVVASTAPGGSTNTYLNIAPTRGVFAVDIEKSHERMKVRPLAMGTLALAQTDLNFGNFMLQSEYEPNMSAVIGHFPNVLNVDYTGQFAWDSVNVDWNNGIQPLEISDLVVIRFF